MATQTTYYNFNKPSGTDLVNPLVDTNPNWDIADDALHELNERSVANCTEVVSLGVHALSTLNTDTKFLKWIATANFTAGDTFTLNGIAVAAATPSGASLATNAYVAGAVVMACLNADNSAMTVFLSGTNVATDSERLGGELPSYYATDSDMGNAQTDITNIQNLLGNTSIAGIGDGSVTGAIDTINSLLPDTSYSSTEEVVGTWFGSTLYRKSYTASGTFTADVVLDAAKTPANTNIVKFDVAVKDAANEWTSNYLFTVGGNYINAQPKLSASGLKLYILGGNLLSYNVTIYYTKN